MVIVDESGNELESVDMTLGRLVDDAWIDHPARAQQGHYAYEKTEGGGVVQRYVVDSPASSAWREVTRQRYVPYTQDELSAIRWGDFGARLNDLEESSRLNSAQIQAVSDRGDFVEDCIAEMAEIVYA